MMGDSCTLFYFWGDLLLKVLENDWLLVVNIFILIYIVYIRLFLNYNDYILYNLI